MAFDYGLNYYLQYIKTVIFKFNYLYLQYLMYCLPQTRTTEKLRQEQHQRSRSRSFSRHKTNPSRKPVFREPYNYQNYHQTDPEVAAFQIDICNTDQSLYTHNLRIDYGKLEKPYPQKASANYLSGMQNTKINNIATKVKEGSNSKLHKLLPSKNVNIKQAIILETLNTCNDYTENRDEDDGHAKKQIKTSRTKHSLQSSKKESTYKIKRNNDSQPSKRAKVNIISSNTENSQRSQLRMVLSQPSSRKTIVMRLSDVRALEKKPSTPMKIKTKMVKTIIAGGKTQFKLIKYPDTTDYLKLCGIKEKNKKNLKQ